MDKSEDKKDDEEQPPPQIPERQKPQKSHEPSRKEQQQDDSLSPIKMDVPDRATAVPHQPEENSFRQSEQPSYDPNANPYEDPNVVLNVNFAEEPEFDKKGNKGKGIEDNVANNEAKLPGLKKKKTASGFNRGEPPGGSHSLEDESAQYEPQQVAVNESIKSEQDCDFDSENEN